MERTVWRHRECSTYLLHHCIAFLIPRISHLFTTATHIFNTLQQLVATDPEIITHIFTRNVYKYAKSPYFRPLIERLGGRSILWAEGDDHKRMAKVLSASFKPERVRGMHEATVESAQRVSWNFYVPFRILKIANSGTII